MKEERYHIALDRYDKNIVLNALNNLRNQQVREERPTDPCGRADRNGGSRSHTKGQGDALQVP